MNASIAAEIETMLYEAAHYADAIAAIAEVHEDDPSYRLLADKCSGVILKAIDALHNMKEGATK